MPVILVGFEFIRNLLVFVMKLIVLKYSCQKPVKKKCERPVLLEEIQAAKHFSKVFLHFNKIPNSLKQVLQTYSETCIFLCTTKKSPPEAAGKDWSQSAREILRWNWWRCDEIHVIVNFDQKYEGNWGYYVYHFSYGFLIFFKCYDFTVL